MKHKTYQAIHIQNICILLNLQFIFKALHNYIITFTIYIQSLK